MSEKRVLVSAYSRAKAANMTVLVICICLIAAAGAGCGGGAKVNTNIYVPDLDQGQYNDTYYREGWKNLKEGNPKQAVKNFQQSSVMDEKLFVGFGYAFLAQNKFELAKKNFEKCLTLNPENLQAQFGLATMFELLEDKERAFRIYSKLRASHPGNAWVKVRYDYIKSTETENYLKKAEQFKKENRQEAYIAALETASQFSPEIIDIKTEIADFFVSQQQYDQAARQYEVILEKQPNNETVLMRLAQVYEKINKFDSAVVIYRKMLELKPGDLSIINKINELKIKFFELNLPVKFKNIYFKDAINREELAALIGFYFEKYLESRPPEIITDIGGSFAKEYIIKVSTLGIMQLRPDHSFDRFSSVTRAAFAVVIDALLKYLEKHQAGGYSLQFTPMEDVIEPADISPLHKDYVIIKFLVNSEIMKLDEKSNFNPTAVLSPSEALVAIRKILNSIHPGIGKNDR